LTGERPAAPPQSSAQRERASVLALLTSLPPFLDLVQDVRWSRAEDSRRGEATDRREEHCRRTSLQDAIPIRRAGISGADDRCQRCQPLGSGCSCRTGVRTVTDMCPRTIRAVGHGHRGSIPRVRRWSMGSKDKERLGIRHRTVWMVGAGPSLGDDDGAHGWAALRRELGRLSALRADGADIDTTSVSTSALRPAQVLRARRCRPSADAARERQGGSEPDNGQFAVGTGR
jgi:hypothetical protein